MFKLEPHQVDAVDKGLPILLQYKLLYIAGQPRIGKTLTSLVIAQKAAFNKVIFITKKAAIQSIQEDIKLLNPKYEHLVINYESLHKVRNYKEFDLVICDEAHNMAKFPKPSKRHRMVKAMFRNIPIIFLSGTPNPESFSQLYHQYNVSSFSPWAHYVNFYRWAKDYVIIKQQMINSTLINDYSLGCESKILEDTRKYTVTISQEDANFKSFVEEKIHEVEMTQLQREYYKEMEKHFIISSLDIAATNAADRVNKLAQISSGTIIDSNGNPTILKNNKKIQYIKDNFSDIKIAIFYKYQAERILLEDNFHNITTDPQFFNKYDDSIFIGQFQSIREGVNLKSADAIVMFNIDFSSTSYWQARSRLQHKDRTKEAIIHWLFSIGGIERYVYSAVCNKKHFTSKYFESIKKI